MKFCIATLLILGWVGQDEPAPKPLFDGKTLDGWEGNLEVFRVEDGAIVAGSLENRIPRNEFLCTKRKYADFELRLKCKIVPPDANAGVQFRSARIPNHHEVIGYQADMGESWWGKLYDESRRRKVLAGPDEKKLAEVLKPDDYNEYVIRCRGGHVELWINGLQTADYHEPDKDLPEQGIIGLQIHAGPPAEAWYKDITLLPLPGVTSKKEGKGQE